MQFHLSLSFMLQKEIVHRFFFPKGNGSPSKVPESVLILAEIRSAQLDIFGLKPY